MLLLLWLLVSIRGWGTKIPQVTEHGQNKYWGYLWCDVKSLSCVRLFATPWTVAYQAPPSIGFSRQEYWSRLPFPSPGALPDPGTEPVSPALAGGFLTTEPPGKHFLFSLTNIQLKLSICFNYKSRPQIAAALMGLVHLSPTEAIGVFRSHCNWHRYLRTSCVFIISLKLQQLLFPLPDLI